MNYGNSPNTFPLPLPSDQEPVTLSDWRARIGEQIDKIKIDVNGLESSLDQFEDDMATLTSDPSVTLHKLKEVSARLATSSRTLEENLDSVEVDLLNVQRIIDPHAFLKLIVAAKKELAEEDLNIRSLTVGSRGETAC